MNQRSSATTFKSKVSCENDGKNLIDSMSTLDSSRMRIQAPDIIDLTKQFFSSLRL